MIKTCERCSRQVADLYVCHYCQRAVCNHCLKSSKRVKKVDYIYICKDCWSNMKFRKDFKSL